MTPFELWRAGKGEEPVVVVDPETASRFAGPARKLSNFVIEGHGAWLAHAREQAEAAEECRDALELAIRFLPSFGDWIPATKGEDPWAR